MPTDWSTILILLGSLGGFGVIYAIIKYGLDWFFKKQQIKGIEDFQQTISTYNLLVENFNNSEKNIDDINEFIKKLLASMKERKIDPNYLEKELEGD